MFQVWQGIPGINPENLNFFVSFEIAEIFLFSELFVYTQIVLLKTFPQHFELCLYCKY